MHQGESSGDLALDRLVFFSDAVFAIAITLLIIEIEIPDLQPGISIAESWAEFASLKWSFFAFALSFLVIGRFWMGHHERFRSLKHYDPRLMWPNMLYLMAIAFMPFATAFLGRNIGHFLPALVYNLTMLLLSLLALWLAKRIRAAGGGGIPHDGLDIVFAALACVALTFVLPLISQWGMMTMPLWSFLERRYAAARATA
jgi:uncharacterized membrane protein